MFACFDFFFGGGGWVPLWTSELYVIVHTQKECSFPSLSKAVLHLLCLQFPMEHSLWCLRVPQGFNLDVLRQSHGTLIIKEPDFFRPLEPQSPHAVKEVSF